MKTLKEHNERVEALKSGVRLSGVLCDECQTEMVDNTEDSKGMFFVGQTLVVCPSCGYKGNKRDVAPMEIPRSLRPHYQY